MFRRLHLLYRLYRDPRTPALAKSLPVLALLYLLLPVDVIPDILAPVGILDDIIAVVTLVSAGMKMIPKSVYDTHKDTKKEE